MKQKPNTKMNWTEFTMDLITQENKQYYRNLKRNMLTTVVIVSFLPMILVGSIILYQFQNSYSEKVTANLENLVNRHRMHIDTFLKERENNLLFLAASYSFEELSDEFFLQKQLGTLQSEYGSVFSDLGVVDYQGNQVAYAGPYKLEKAVYSDAEWFKKAIASKNYISDVFPGLRGFPHFIVTVRRFHEGKPWILRTTVDFQAFNTLVRNIRIGKTGVAFIMNRKEEFQTETSLDISMAGRFYHLAAKSIKPGEEIRSGRHRNVWNHTVEDWIFVAGFLKNRDWALIYFQDSGDALKDLVQAKWLAFATFSIVALMILAMAVFISRSMVGKIAQADHEKEMMNQQVIESGRLASLGEMAAGIAHEINNPVAIMVEEAGWAGDILEEEEFAESKNISEYQRALAQIKKQGLRCRDITQKLLSFARRSDSKLQEVNINGMVDEVIGLFSHQAKFGNVVILSNHAEEPPCVRASQTEIQQVLFNLINNAMDALNESGGKIVINTGYEGDMVLVEVKDNGPGIPRSDLSSIFDPFYTTKPLGKGTGLGLSICYGILNKIGGNISVSSAVGVGSTFRIHMPYSSEDKAKNKNDGNIDKLN